VLRAAGETETKEENIQDSLLLDEEDLGLQLLTEEDIAAVIFFSFIFSSVAYIIIFSIYLLSKLFLPFRATFCFINPD
jgi:hypothetical protein